MVAAYGEQLLEWLNVYVPYERKVQISNIQENIEDFLDELLRSGTTTALVWLVHQNPLMHFSKKPSMKSPDDCRQGSGPQLSRVPQDTPDSSYSEIKALIERWHNKGRLQYAVTPRFAPTSTKEQLDKAGELLKEFPSVYLHTHLSENINEIAWVKELFPNNSGYLDVYKASGLLGRRSVFAHCVHLDDREWSSLSQSQSGIAFCPTSNLFLGSGLFCLNRACNHGVNVGLGTDMVVGHPFNATNLKRSLQDTTVTSSLSPFQGLYLATLGGATTLDLQDKISERRRKPISLFRQVCYAIDGFQTPTYSTLFEELFVLP